MRIERSRTLIGQVTELFLLATMVSLGFFLAGAFSNRSFEHWYLVWNLGLAWVPFALSVLIRNLLRTRRWSSWPLLGLTLLWLGFLPNAFYILTDYIHLYDVPRVDETFDVVMFGAFIGTGMALGFASVALIHEELRKRLPPLSAWRIVGLVLLLVSFAIYVGRFLRWNTWDIIANPAGILFDISERIIHPTAHPQTYATTISFFILLATGYYCTWRLAALMQKPRR